MCHILRARWTVGDLGVVGVRNFMFWLRFIWVVANGKTEGERGHCRDGHKRERTGKKWE